MAQALRYFRKTMTGAIFAASVCVEPKKLEETEWCKTGNSLRRRKKLPNSSTNSTCENTTSDKTSKLKCQGFDLKTFSACSNDCVTCLTELVRGSLGHSITCQCLSCMQLHKRFKISDAIKHCAKCKCDICRSICADNNNNNIIINSMVSGRRKSCKKCHNCKQAECLARAEENNNEGEKCRKNNSIKPYMFLSALGMKHENNIIEDEEDDECEDDENEEGENDLEEDEDDDEEEEDDDDDDDKESEKIEKYAQANNNHKNDKRLVNNENIITIIKTNSNKIDQKAFQYTPLSTSTETQKYEEEEDCDYDLN